MSRTPARAVIKPEPLPDEPTTLGLLAALLPAVNRIHDGCPVCLEHWVERSNRALRRLGVPYRFARPVDELGRPIERPDGKMADLVLVPSEEA